MKMLKTGLILTLLTITGVSQAQWRNTKHHYVVSALAGGGINLGNIEKPAYYQLIGRGMWYWKRPLAFGGEMGFTRASGQYMQYDAASLNAFAHLKLPFGFYGEAGVGAIGVISDGRTATYSNAGRFMALGFAKSLGPLAAVDVQYRKAPSLQSDGEKNLNSGIRLGLSFKF